MHVVPNKVNKNKHKKAKDHISEHVRIFNSFPWSPTQKRKEKKS
jgi:hypothetical protein